MLGGFPGPYSSFVHKTIGTGGILHLMTKSLDRAAHFQSTVATCVEKDECKIFSGTVQGVITHRAGGRAGFGFDPIFIPEGETRTFAQMPQRVKNLYSHRARAFEKFAKWYLSSRSLRSTV